MEIEYVPTDSLKPNEYNPNEQTGAQFRLLLKSIKEDGFIHPILARRSDSVIIDGEHRWRALVKLKVKRVPVIFADMDEAQMRISTLRHNRARGKEDQNLVDQIFQSLSDLGYMEQAGEALLLTGAECRAYIEKAESVLQDDPVDCEEEEDTVQYGDSYELNLTWVGEDAIKAKKFLGSEPRKNLLNLCRVMS